ncbi:MAG: GTP-binding protein TypA [Candidatus Fraserbacteria bacterium RBG_16_55_9]|uniref:Large ribosomal subunit assembly factor BipA n=1 Tax=Fraserbacteria sp. (strain RBG_16_55_9) TaxID=1817864 RepID=A0A1F5UU93_FRAXR|nr:MAG: GTP-binding protein TypA [Candidatus Fraserbacteria bacterium RBG_16_55_9]
MTKTQQIRNIAIIAHVDHGKTTLVDAMLQQTHTFNERQEIVERVMDSMDLERERGITIKAKNASIQYQGVKINIVDTPGHADFGGEVERTLRMVDGVLLLVDAKEGPMPQTKFVLRKALTLGHRAIVVINKVDLLNAPISEVAEQTFHLFYELGATDEQLDFPIVYTSAVAGTATLDMSKPSTDLTPLFETILKRIPEPEILAEEPMHMLVLALDYNPYKGKIGIGKLEAGAIRRGQKVLQIKADGSEHLQTVTDLLVFKGLQRQPVEEVHAGEIVAVAGIEDISIGETITDAENPKRMLPVDIDEPTMQMTFGVNTSPFSGRDGQPTTSRMLRERLLKECETNVSLRVEETSSADQFLVAGRGELHLAILIETMRREGFEMQISQPVVLLKDINGVQMEPVEIVSIEVPSQFSGVIMEELGRRRGVWQGMHETAHGALHYTFLVATRNLFGLKNLLLSRTNGTIIVHHRFESYEPVTSKPMERTHGSLVSMMAGMTTAYALNNIQERGALFVGPGIQVYEGMVLGQSSRNNDLEVNPAKGKKLSNMRAAGSDELIVLAQPMQMTLEIALEYIGPDELVEVTPKNIRIRKHYLTKNERERMAKRQS